MTNDRRPKKFVGLHSHSTYSIGDAIGAPEDHIEYARENEMDAIALTDHGNMNGFARQYLHWQKLEKQGAPFKAIPGCEMYYVDSLAKWRELYEDRRRKQAEAREAKKQAAKEKKAKERAARLGDPYASTKEDMDDLTSEDDEAGTVVENEEESKYKKFKDPVKQRNHVVLLPKNPEGLKSLFELVSRSYKEGFYFFPRIDLEMLKQHAKGNIVALTACIAGRPAKSVFDWQTEDNWELWTPSDENFENIQSDLKEVIDGFQWALGEENYYLELQFNKLNAQHLVNQHLIEASNRTNAPLVVTVDAHYSHPQHWRDREIYRMMAWAGKNKGDFDTSKLPESVDDLKCELYPKNADQLWQSYKESTQGKGWDFYDDNVVCDAIERSWTIAHEQIENPKPDVSVKLPKVNRLVDSCRLEDHYGVKDPDSEELDEDTLAFKELKEQAIEGAKVRGVADKPEYIDRLKDELKVIKHLRFSKYFLTYSKIMEITSRNLLTGNARGSAGGSLLAYVLNITQIDPIKYGLLFERFLSRFKKGMPDIDSDFSDRERAVELIAEHFGKENVIPISNFNQLQLRSLIKDLGRMHGIPFEEINKYTRNIENEALAEAKKTPGFDRQQWVLTLEEAEDKSETFRKLMDEHPELEQHIKVLFKQMRNISRHAGGVIITDNPERHMPLIVAKGKVVQTPWQEGLNFRHLESLGLLKFDILGLGTLRMFESTIRRILKKEGKEYVTFRDVRKWFYENLHPDNNPMDDQHVYEHVYHDGRWAGVFQFVQPPVQKFVRKMKPTSILELATATSIYRPGPLGIGADKMYLSNRANPGSIQYKHPLLKEVLEPTCGLIVFQEQLQLIYHKLAGVPLEETDMVRKAFTKKDLANKEESERQRRQMREDFAGKCLTANNIPKETSYEVFDEMEKFVAYSFNKSHATAYSVTSYQCAWLLTYYPDEWIASYIDYCATEKGHQAGKESPLSIALGEAKSLGYKIGKPDINTSEDVYQVKDGVLVPSFRALKHVGLPALREIRQHRPYRTIEDLLWGSDESWRHSKFNKRALSTLIKLEAFESMDLVGEDKPIKNYRQLHWILVEHYDDLKRACSRKKPPRPRELLWQYALNSEGMDDWTLDEKIKHSEELAGSVDINLIITPEVRQYLEEVDLGSIDEWKHEKQYLWCVVKDIRERKTRTSGKPFLDMKVYGESGSEMRCFVWGYKPNKHRQIPKNTLIISKFKKSDFGLSTFFGAIEVLTRNSEV